MKKYKTVLFDLDGTLTDPGEGITNSVAYALKKYNIIVEDRTELYKFIGPPLWESFKMFYGFSKEEAERAVEYYREYYRDIGIWENSVYDGIEELLINLKNNGYKLIVATSKPEVFARQILEHYGLDKHFDYIAGGTLDGTRIKKDEVIAYALETCEIADTSEVIICGDRAFDVIGAKKWGIDSIGVLFGYGSREELEDAGATFVAENVEDIFKILSNN